MISQKTGQDAEQKALTHLLKQGLTLVTQNYRCRLGEIDLIMRDGSYLVFIEVRSRTSMHYGDGIESITYSKRQKIIKATLYYMMKNKLQEKMPLRFDVIGINNKSGSINWIKDAFNVDF